MKELDKIKNDFFDYVEDNFKTTTEDVTPTNYIWLFDIALRQNDNSLIAEALEYGKRLEEKRIREEVK